MARRPDNTTLPAVDPSILEAEQRLRSLIAAARPEDAWTKQVIQVFPAVCGASEKLFPLLALVPAECQRALGTALFNCGMFSSSEALFLGCAEVDRSGSLELPNLADRQEALALVGFAQDAAICPLCARRPMPSLRRTAGALSAIWTDYEVRRFGWPASCRPEIAAKSCPEVDWQLRKVRKEWEKASASRLRRVIRESMNDLVWTVLPLSAAAVVLYLLLNDSVGELSALVPAALPFVPAAWGVNLLLRHSEIEGRSLIPWSMSISVGAAYSALPELLVVSIIFIVDMSLSPLLLVSALSGWVGSSLIYAVATRQGRPLKLLSQLLPEPGEDPTAPS